MERMGLLCRGAPPLPSYGHARADLHRRCAPARHAPTYPIGRDGTMIMALAHRSRSVSAAIDIFLARRGATLACLHLLSRERPASLHRGPRIDLGFATCEMSRIEQERVALMTT